MLFILRKQSQNLLIILIFGELQIVSRIINDRLLYRRYHFGIRKIILKTHFGNHFSDTKMTTKLSFQNVNPQRYSSKWSLKIRL